MAILDDYIHDSDAAAEIHVTTRTTARYRNEPDGLPYYVIGGRIYYHKDEFRDWLRKRVRKPNPRRGRAA